MNAFDYPNSLLLNARYFFHVLLLTRAIEEILHLFHIWSHPKSDSSMYKKNLLKDWPSFHLQHCGWYLDCPPDSILVSERTLRKMFDPRFMDKLMSNEANNNEETENMRKKKRLVKGSFDRRHRPIVFEQQSLHLEVCTLREGPIQESPSR